MSWNASRFARIAHDIQPSDALNLWLSADALARIHADGGYLPSPDAAFAIVQEAVATYGTVMLGLAGLPDWDKDGSNLDAEEFVNQRIVSVVGAEGCNEIADAYLRERSASLTDYHLDVARFLARAPLGGETWNARGETMSLWGADPRMRHPLIETLAAALTLYADPQARSDAACVQSLERVQVMKPAKAKRAKTSPTRDVHVIDVKRPALRSVGDVRANSVEHDHRWVVRGHWRNQPCGKGRSQRRRIWIQEHVAGPEDKPLRRDTRVYRIA